MFTVILNFRIQISQNIETILDKAKYIVLYTFCLKSIYLRIYAILLAFVAAIAAVVFSQGYDITMVEDVTGNDKFVGNNLLSSIWAAIRNAHSMLSRMLSF